MDACLCVCLYVYMYKPIRFIIHERKEKYNDFVCAFYLCMYKLSIDWMQISLSFYSLLLAYNCRALRCDYSARGCIPFCFVLLASCLATKIYVCVCVPRSKLLRFGHQDSSYRLSTYCLLLE